MYFDHFTLAALADALRTDLIGSRLQRVLAVEDWSIGLELYNTQRRRYLYLSADQQAPRIQLLPERLRRGLAKPQPLTQYLRRHLIGARLSAIQQPPWERILHLEWETQERTFTLIVEPMVRRANVLLVEGGTIRECLRRVGPSQNRFRLSLPQHRYQPPPPQSAKRAPWPITNTELQHLLAAAGEVPLAGALVKTFLGFSPLLAREICQRANHPPQSAAAAADSEAIRAALAKLLVPLLARAWQPGFSQEKEAVLAYSVYPLQHLPKWQPCAEIHEALAQYYGAPIGADAYRAAKAPYFKAIEKAGAEFSRREDSLQRGLLAKSELESLRLCGELLLVYQQEILPGQSEFHAEYDSRAEPLTIAIDPQKSARDNAQDYFQRYRKAKRAQAAAPKRLAAWAKEKALLEQLTNDLQLAESWPEIDEVATALRATGHLPAAPSNRPSPQRSGPLRLVVDGYVIWIGRNLRQNGIILNRHSQPHDLWFHARACAGAHLLIRDDGRIIPEQLIERVARVAAHMSARRNDARVAVDFTQRRYVRSSKGAARALVRYSNERTLFVTPAAIPAVFPSSS